jgi:hypothetical protein
VSDGERLRRGSLAPEEKAKWQAEAWYLMDRQKLGSRSISKKWAAEHDFHVSHVTILKWVNEAREQAEILKLFGPAQVRAGQLGRIEDYLEHLWTAVQTGEMPPDVGFKLIHQYESLLTKVSGSAAPTRSQLEITSAERAHPDTLLLEELRKFAEQEEKMKEMESNDGLMD